LHCLSFDLRLCITPLVSPNLSHRWPRIYSVCHSQKSVFLLAWLNVFFIYSMNVPQSWEIEGDGVFNNLFVRLMDTFKVKHRGYFL
jgi:hypothetical protein